MILVALIAAYALTLGALALGQRRLMYFPSAATPAPDTVGLAQARVLHIGTDDGETLLAWFVAPAEGRPLILYFQGNAQGLAARNVRFQNLVATGDGLLAIQYRGYGGSSGAPSEEGLNRDAEAAYNEALALGIPGRRIVAMGESLGTGVAVALAARHEMAALVLDSAYSSTVAIAASRLWMFPVRLFMHDQYRSDRKIGAVRSPVLMVHGARDPTIPIRFAESLFAQANDPKRFIRVEGAGHLAMGEVLPQVLAWIDEAAHQDRT